MRTAFALLALAFALGLALATTGCSTIPLVTTGCLQILPEPGHESTVHLLKAGQPVPDDSLLVATVDDPEAHHDAVRARQHAIASLPLGLGGIAFTVVGLSLTADGAHNTSSRELYVGAPLAAVGVAALVAAVVELKLSGRRGLRAVDGYNQRHPAPVCR
jgi:hypothetical protein